MSNRTVQVAGTLSGNIVLAERLNYEERTRYLIIVQANVRLLTHKTSFTVMQWFHSDLVLLMHVRGLFQGKYNLSYIDMLLIIRDNTF